MSGMKSVIGRKSLARPNNLSLDFSNSDIKDDDLHKVIRHLKPDASEFAMENPLADAD